MPDREPGASIILLGCFRTSSTAWSTSSPGPRPICRPTCARRCARRSPAEAPADARRPGADDHRAEHRSGGVAARGRSARTPACRPSRSRCRSAPIRSSCASRSARRWPRRPGAASCARTRSTRSPARTPATTSGPGTPIIHFDQWDDADIEVKLILKGGGCENTNAQYSLPAELDHLGRADRTLEGVRKCILHAVWKAQGKGCAPARSASASAAIARPATCTPRSSCSGRSTT